MRLPLSVVAQQDDPDAEHDHKQDETEQEALDLQGSPHDNLECVIDPRPPSRPASRAHSLASHVERHALAMIGMNGMHRHNEVLMVADAGAGLAGWEHGGMLLPPRHQWMQREGAHRVPVHRVGYTAETRRLMCS